MVLSLSFVMRSRAEPYPSWPALNCPHFKLRLTPIVTKGLGGFAHGPADRSRKSIKSERSPASQSAISWPVAVPRVTPRPLQHSAP